MLQGHHLSDFERQVRHPACLLLGAKLSLSLRVGGVRSTCRAQWVHLTHQEKLEVAGLLSRLDRQRLDDCGPRVTWWVRKELPLLKPALAPVIARPDRSEPSLHFHALIQRLEELLMDYQARISPLQQVDIDPQIVLLLGTQASEAMCLRAVQRDVTGQLFSRLDPVLRSKAVCIAAVQASPKNAAWVPLTLKDAEAIFLAVAMDPRHELKDLPMNARTLSVCEASCKTSRRNLKYVPLRLRRSSWYTKLRDDSIEGTLCGTSSASEATGRRRIAGSSRPW